MKRVDLTHGGRITKKSTSEHTLEEVKRKATSKYSFQIKKTTENRWHAEDGREYGKQYVAPKQPEKKELEYCVKVLEQILSK